MENFEQDRRKKKGLEKTYVYRYENGCYSLAQWQEWEKRLKTNWGQTENMRRNNTHIYHTFIHTDIHMHTYPTGAKRKSLYPRSLSKRPFYDYHQVRKDGSV